MTALQRPVDPGGARGVRLQRHRTLVDVAGGHGAVLTSILKKYPAMRGVLVRPRPRDRRRDGRASTAPGLADRCTRSPGDFFKAVPAGGDAYIMKHIIHDWDDERAPAILRNIRTAIGPNGGARDPARVGDSAGQRSPISARSSTSRCWCMPGGSERTDAEFRALFARAGLRADADRADAVAAQRRSRRGSGRAARGPSPAARTGKQGNDGRSYTSRMTAQSYANHAHRPTLTAIGGFFVVVAVTAFTMRWRNEGGQASMAVGLLALGFGVHPASYQPGLHHQAAGPDHQAGDARACRPVADAGAAAPVRAAVDQAGRRPALCIGRGTACASRADGAGKSLRQPISSAPSPSGCRISTGRSRTYPPAAAGRYKESAWPSLKSAPIPGAPAPSARTASSENIAANTARKRRE